MCDKKVLNASRQKCAPPGLTTSLYFADIDWIDTFPGLEDYLNNPTTTAPLNLDADITFNVTDYPDAGWYEWKVDTASADVLMELLGESAKYMNTNLPFKMAGHDPEMEQHIQWSHGAELICAATDKLGRIRIVGDLNNPLSMFYKDQMGLKGGDYNGFEFDLKIEGHGSRWPYYEGRTLTPIYLAP